MFEHLGPRPNGIIEKNSREFGVYFSLLVLAVLVFLFSFGLFGSSPTSKAQQKAVLHADFVSIEANKNIVVDTPKVNLYDFAIGTKQNGVVLHKLYFQTKGVFDRNLLENIYLVHNNKQLGNFVLISNQADLIFEFNGLVLDKGVNNFSLVLVNNDIAQSEDVIEISMENRYNINLSYDESYFSPVGEFPASSGLISFSEKGKVSAFNNYDSDNYFLVANQKNTLANISIFNNAETVDVREIHFSSQGSRIDGNKFSLLWEDQKIGETVANGNEIVFVLDKALVASVGKNLKIKLVSEDLGVGTYHIFLEELVSTGFVSGQSVNIADRLDLGELQLVSYFPEFSNGNNLTLLSPGWNTLYDLNVSSQGSLISLEKLTWDVEYFGLEVDQIEVWVDGKPSSAEIAYNQAGQLEFVWDEPVTISTNGSNIQLLADINILENSAAFQTRLVSDNSETTEYIMWSVGSSSENSYKLPKLPLSPTILVK